jgi:hypothetical protein
MFCLIELVIASGNIVKFPCYLGTSFKVRVLISEGCDVTSKLINFSQERVLMDIATGLASSSYLSCLSTSCS